MRNLLLLVATIISLSATTPARADGECAAAIAEAEQRNNLPAHILQAIGVVESGRRDPLTGRLEPWPWAVNAAGDGHLFESKPQAIAFVREAQAHGIRSIDVGCMQINLMHHPNAFASLDEAFTPEANVRYATAFLLDLHRRTGDWAAATGAYHSFTPDLSQEYAARVRSAMTAEPQFAAAFPPPAEATPALPRSATVILVAAAAQRVRVIEPGTAPVQPIGLRATARLPRVFYP